MFPEIFRKHGAEWGWSEASASVFTEIPRDSGANRATADAGAGAGLTP